MYKKTPLWHSFALAFPLAISLFPVVSYAACNAGDVGGAAYLELPVAPGGTTANVYGQREANEPGLEGITVKVTDSAGTAQSATTDSDGNWSVAAPTFPVRVEFTWAQAWLKSSVNGVGNNTSVQFVMATDCNTNFGAQNPDDYSSTANPIYITNLQQNGSGAGNTNPSIQNVHYADTGLNAAFADYNGDAGTGPIPSSSASVEQVGSTWGKAFQKNTQRLFASTVLQRHIGFSPTGDAGSVYVLDYSAGVPGTLLGSFNLQGVTPANGGDAIDLGSVCRSAACASAAGNTGRDLDYILDADIGTPNIDLDAFTKVGKMSFGDIDVEQTTNVLWLTNLKQKSLISVDVSGGFAALPGTVNQYLITGLPGAPSCTGGELRPWALSMHQGRGYLGAVCDALTSQNAADMTAYVLSFDAAKPADGFKTEISFPLNYDKDGLDWNPWSDTDKKVGNEWKSYIQPILSDIEFDENNNMYLAFLDRYGLQAGFYNFAPIPGITSLYAAAGNREKTESLGEILKVCHTTGGFSLEGTADCPAGNYGNEFFNDLGYADAPDAASGSLALLKGSQQLLLSFIDPHPETEAGVSYWVTQGTTTLSTKTGAIANWYSNVSSKDEANGYNGKSHSMGDIELLTDAAPVEVGNHVWLDANSNGIQDAGEAGIDGVAVKLACGTDEATASTADGGKFYFSNAAGGNATFMGNGESCTIKVDDTQVAVKDYKLTIQNADGVTDNNALTDLRDSDATDNAGTAEIAFSVGNAGENNHTLDIGYKSAPAVDFGDAPDSYKTTLAVNGARHTIVAGLNLGAVVDAEADGQPNAAADGDGADEDGIQFLTQLVPGEEAIIGVGTTQPQSSTAKLDAWIDFNGDGDFDDAGEQVAVSQLIKASALIAQGSLLLDVTVPSDAKAGTTYARFRLSTAGGLLPSGDAADGEVQDYQVTIVQGATLGDYVWQDTNQDGVQNSGEPGVAGVLVNLIRVSDGAVVKSAFTDSKGAYLFTHLLPDTYQVEFVAPTGYHFTTVLQGGDVNADSNADSATGRTANITLVEGDNQRQWDAGLVMADNTVVHCDAVPFKPTELSETLSLPKFDGSLGTLTGVSVSSYNATRQMIVSENSAAQTQKFKIVSSVNGSMTLPNADTVDTVTSYDSGYKNLSVADGILDYYGSSALTLADWLYATNSKTVAYTPLADFIAATAGDVINLLYETQSGLSMMGGGGNVQTVQRTRGAVGACVAYTYEKKAAVVDLAVTKVANKTTVKHGDTVVYTLTVSNTGADAATGVQVADKLPTGVTYVSDDGDAIHNGSYDAVTGIWTVGDIATGASKILKLTVTVN